MVPLALRDTASILNYVEISPGQLMRIHHPTELTLMSGEFLAHDNVNPRVSRTLWDIPEARKNFWVDSPVRSVRHSAG